ncbi:MAG TPA: DUF5916 domain-containing protein [Vicinamibacterales bacterium]|nr:DUF5916 domain-containing protein [Vicinamibacterales bacterium]
MRPACALVLALVLGAARNAAAQAPSASGPAEPAFADKEGKSLRAFHLVSSVPKVDGRLDDEAWTLADSIGDFTQIDPDNMAPATERTTVQVAFDSRYLYVAVHCFLKDPATVATGLGRRDNIPNSDRLNVNFDPRHDHQTGYTFQVNASGVQGDFTFFDDNRTSSDYDGVWDAAAQVTGDGWTAEMRIPFSQLRFNVPVGETAVWGFNVERQDARTGEVSRWMPTPRGVQGTVSRFGHLVFSDRLTPPRRIELVPFTLASALHNSAVSVDRNKASFNGGLDMRVGLGTSTTVSATLNPDFGQVEADPAVLNLSVFETFFPEKRPFFLEDSRTFVLPYGQVPDFYSRRIGQAPGRIKLTDAETLVRKPDQTTILGAVKLTGKKSGWTYGGLTALTAREYAVVDVKTTGTDGAETIVRNDHRLIEPATMYSVGRVQRDILHSSSNVGFVGTGVIRGAGQLDAFTGGPDYNLRWSKNRFNFNGHFIGTHAPINGTMRDAYGHVQNLNFNSKHATAFLHIDHFDKDFRNNDVGFLSSRTNKNDFNAGAGYQRPDPGKYLRQFNVWTYYDRQWNADRLVFGNSAESEVFFRFKNYWWMDTGGGRNARRFDDLDTRGGPPIVKPSSGFAYFNVSSDPRKSWNVFLHLDTSRDEKGGWSRAIGPTLRIQPSNQLQASIAANYTSAQDIAQWIKNEDLDGDGVSENIYGRLRRNVVNVTGRATYAFSPDMTLEAYLQPFVAVGDYTDVRKLARAKSFDFAPVAIAENPDFNNKSLRGTIVMRWEYLRGSTLFVVWNMAASDKSRPGEFSGWRDLGTSFTAPGTNAFVVKLTYWLTP